MNRHRGRTHAFLLALAVAVFACAPSALAQPAEPGRGAEPRSVPPPGPPISTSGSDVTAPAPLLPATPSSVPAGEPMSEERRREIEARLAVDEARLKTLEEDLGPLRHLKVQGYVQLQYRVLSFNAAASPNLVNGSLPAGISANDVVAKTDGTTTNTNLFRLRRTRLRTMYETEIVRVATEIDLFPAGGPTAADGTIARLAEATGIAHWTKDIKTEFSGGLFKVPFRAEIVESSMFRPYIERTYASQSLFPSERDLGIHAKTIYGQDLLALDLGILNGQRLGEREFVLQPDLNSAKDFYGTLTLKTGPIGANVSGYLGRGVLVDTDPQALRVKNFVRRGVNVGATFAKTFAESLGETKIMSELLFGTNMDTGVFHKFALPVIPVTFIDPVQNLNERGFYIRVDQEITKWGIAGFRYDTYTTDSAIKNNARDTYTFMAGGRFSKYLRLINEVSYVIDNLHPAGTPPPSQHIFGYTGWVQGTFY